MEEKMRKKVFKVKLYEQPMKEYPQYMLRNMAIYLAPRQTIGIYLDGKMYESQEIMQKDIGVDTACYAINRAASSLTLIFMRLVSSFT